MHLYFIFIYWNSTFFFDNIKAQIYYLFIYFLFKQIGIGTLFYIIVGNPVSWHRCVANKLEICVFFRICYPKNILKVAKLLD